MFAISRVAVAMVAVFRMCAQALTQRDGRLAGKRIGHARHEIFFGLLRREMIWDRMDHRVARGCLPIRQHATTNRLSNQGTRRYYRLQIMHGAMPWWQVAAFPSMNRPSGWRRSTVFRPIASTMPPTRSGEYSARMN
ncbi:MAG: hypothetical protein PS018_07475 [bacterium]|nr:hypothetical protein [bacterium]